MTPFELARLLEYVAKNNAWWDAQDTYERNRRAIKYTDASLILEIRGFGISSFAA